MLQNFIPALVGNDPAELYNLFINSSYVPAVMVLLLIIFLLIGAFTIKRAKKRDHSPSEACKLKTKRLLDEIAKFNYQDTKAETPNEATSVIV